MKLLPAARMRALDERAIKEIGIPGVVLMEEAGRGAARMISAAGWLPDSDAPVVLLAGKGNNGGDALVVARILWLVGYRNLAVGLLGTRERVSGDARINLEIFLKLGGKVVEITDEDAWERAGLLAGPPALVVDGLLGTGLHSEVRGLYARVIAEVNAFAGPILALDIPSGLDADSGRVLGAAVKATATATFAFGKPGLYLWPGREYAGQIEIIDIGIPREWAAAEIDSVELLTKTGISRYLPPRPGPGVHKGNRGHLLLFAGRPGFTGAGLLAAGAGLYAGCGLATLALPAAAAAQIEGCNPALMLKYLSADRYGGVIAPPPAEFESLLAGKQALVIGPGFGLREGATLLLAKLLCRFAGPMVLDADALTLLAQEPEELLPPDPERLILTPHPGEMARLLGCTSRQVQSDRLAAARELARRWRVHLVLKGAGTIIVDPDGRTAINNSGNQLLATAGAGDILSGIIGAFLARGAAPGAAARAGVFLHGHLADRLAAVGRNAGITAVELQRELPAALAEWEGNGVAISSKGLADSIYD